MVTSVVRRCRMCGTERNMLDHLRLCRQCERNRHTREVTARVAYEIELAMIRTALGKTEEDKSDEQESTATDN